jgi:hypothetical protein
MTIRKAVFIAAALALVGLSRYAAAQTSESTAAANPESIRSATIFTIHGKIVDVDEGAKLVTIEANDRRVAFKVENPYNLQAAKVGEPIVIRYYEVVSIRKKKPGEEVPSLSLKQGLLTAQPGGTPGAVAEQHASVVVTVVDVDPTNGTVTLKGPDGAVEKVKARDPKILRHVKAGDELVVKVTMATAIGLDKESTS